MSWMNCDKLPHPAFTQKHCSAAIYGRDDHAVSMLDREIPPGALRAHSTRIPEHIALSNLRGMKGKMLTAPGKSRSIFLLDAGIQSGESLRVRRKSQRDLLPKPHGSSGIPPEIPSMFEQPVTEIIRRDLAVAVGGIRPVPASLIQQITPVFCHSVHPRVSRVSQYIWRDVFPEAGGVPNLVEGDSHLSAPVFPERIWLSVWCGKRRSVVRDVPDQLDGTCREQHIARPENGFGALQPPFPGAGIPGFSEGSHGLSRPRTASQHEGDFSQGLQIGVSQANGFRIRCRQQ